MKRIHHHNHYNGELKQRARELRSHPTNAETILWQDVLRNGKMCGWRFTRQRPVGNYIADFVCLPLNLIIEVDGLTHQWDHTRDEARDNQLQQLGFRVLHFTDEQVMKDNDNVIRTLEAAVTELAQVRAGRAHRTPPP